jgi:hypothetical protein
VVLVDFLCANVDIFAWSPSDMPGIPREVAEHSLDILPHSRAVQQQLRHFDEERRRAMLTVKIRQPSHEFTFGVGMSFIPYPLVLTPVV